MSPASSASSSVVHRERVTPSAGWWIIALLLSAMTSLLALPLTPLGAVITPLVVGAAVIVWMVSLSTRIIVTDSTLTAGRAHIDRSHITAAIAYDEDDSFAQRGRLLDARAFLLLRPWAKTVVRVEIEDPADPTPYWLISTRHADELAAALDPHRS